MDEKNCPNCGAVKRGESCEYCGTRFERDEATVIKSWDGDVVLVIGEGRADG